MLRLRSRLHHAAGLSELRAGRLFIDMHSKIVSPSLMQIHLAAADVGAVIYSLKTYPSIILH